MRAKHAMVAAAVLLGLAGLLPSSAQEPPQRVRGTLDVIEGDRLSVQTREGETLDVRLKEGSDIFVVTPSSLDDVEAGDFVGITSIDVRGRRVALEVHLFAEDLRGVGEGHYAWDLVHEPNMMTNATVAEIEQVGPDRELELTYAAGEGAQNSQGAQTILVPPDIPIVQIERSGTRDMLTPGRPVFLMVEPSDDGPQAVATVIGEGVDPPM
jgi:hypothetical protein